jgi:short subunit dehydrogenase-like uncharacterized protein
MSTLMIYGATGYTGQIAAGYAVAAGLKPILAGRNSARLAQLADEIGVQYRSFDLGDATVGDAISDVSVLLNCAGPFKRTAEPLMTASIRSHVHYLDTSAELDSYLLAQMLDAEAKAAGVMLLPGGGGSVAILGCLAGHAMQRVMKARRVRVALHVAGSMSRGSAISAIADVPTETLMRVDGMLESRHADELREFDFGSGPTICAPVTLPDLVTIWRATGVPNIETFVHVSGDAFPQGDLAALPDGPTPEHRQANRYQAAVEVTGEDGNIVRSVLDTVNGYTFTPLASAEAARRVLGGECLPGFQTPATLFGIGFAETIADTRIRDL